MKVGIDANRRADELKVIMADAFRDSIFSEIERITSQSHDVRGALNSYASECLSQMFDYSAALAASLIMENNAALARQLKRAGLKLAE